LKIYEKEFAKSTIPIDTLPNKLPVLQYLNENIPMKKTPKQQSIPETEVEGSFVIVKSD